MRFCFYLVLLVSTFALTLVGTEATALGNVASTSDSKKMEVKKALTRLRRIHRAETEERMIVPPFAAYYNLLHSTSTTSTQSSQILHAVEDNTPLPKWAKAVVALVSVGIITGAVVGAVMITKMFNKALDTTGSEAA
ncbi:hypothetical protein V7S43_013404 [Phytophthora oleae]|uniref:RxLR effector protein n=1 Tax=Phytophthora oleae TaxID=2107226 RepID=A0ABD3F851_9STRA